MRFLIPLFLGTVLTSPAMAQSMDKKTHRIEVSRVMMHDAADVWEVVAADYGRIAESHPAIVASEYAEGTLKGELGAERFCYFNDKQTKSLKERIVAWDAENMTFDNRILEADGFPLDPDNSLATYRVESLGNGKSRLSFDFEYRTKPAMMGAIAKGQFTNLLEDYMLSVDHHIETGEAVNRDNFKAISKLYE